MDSFSLVLVGILSVTSDSAGSTIPFAFGAAMNS